MRARVRARQTRIATRYRRKETPAQSTRQMLHAGTHRKRKAALLGAGSRCVKVGVSVPTLNTWWGGFRGRQCEVEPKN